VDMVRQNRTWLESRYAGAETRRATCLRDEGLQVYAASLLCARIPLTRGNNFFPDHVRRCTHQELSDHHTNLEQFKRGSIRCQGVSCRGDTACAGHLLPQILRLVRFKDQPFVA
jgi:hypothetical protein